MERLDLYSSRMFGAKLMLHKLYTERSLTFNSHMRKKDERKVYDKAVYELLMDSIDNIRKFLEDDSIMYSDHKRDNKGRLIDVRANFIKRK